MNKDNHKRKASEVQELLKERSKKIEQHLQALREEVTNFTPSVRDAIQKHPMASMGGALAAGVVVGMLLLRQHTPAHVPPWHEGHLAPIAAAIGAKISGGESVEDAVKAVLAGPAPAAGSAQGVGIELMRLLGPILVAWAAQQFGKSEVSGSEA